MNTTPSRDIIIQAIKNEKTTFISDDASFINLIMPSSRKYENLKYESKPNDILVEIDKKNENALKAIEAIAPNLQFFYLDATTDLLNTKFEFVQSVINNKQNVTDSQHEALSLLGLGDDFIREFQSIGLFIDVKASDFQSDEPTIKIAYSDFMNVHFEKAKDVQALVVQTTQQNIHRIANIENKKNSHLYTSGKETTKLFKGTALQSQRLAKVFPDYLNLKNRNQIANDLSNMPISGEVYDLNIESNNRPSNLFAVSGRFAYMLLNYVMDNYKLNFSKSEEGFVFRKINPDTKTALDTMIEETCGINYNESWAYEIFTWDGAGPILGRVCQMFKFDSNWFGDRAVMYDVKYIRRNKSETGIYEYVGKRIATRQSYSPQNSKPVQYLLAQYMCREKIELSKQDKNQESVDYFKFHITDSSDYIQRQKRKALFDSESKATFCNIKNVREQMELNGNTRALRFLKFQPKQEIINDTPAIIHSSPDTLDTFLAQIYATCASDVTLFTTDDGVFSMSLNTSNKEKPITIRKY